MSALCGAIFHMVLSQRDSHLDPVVECMRLDMGFTHRSNESCRHTGFAHRAQSFRADGGNDGMNACPNFAWPTLGSDEIS